jgi:cysteine desulfurase
MNVVYLDNNATTKPAPEVVAAMLPYLQELWGNPSSAHRFGQAARRGIDEARDQLATLVNVRDRELIFTGTGTEASNHAFHGLLRHRTPRRKVITTAVEHSATKEMAERAAVEGIEVVRVGVDEEGRLDLDLFEKHLDDDAAFVTLLWANNETGVLFDVADLAGRCRAAGVPLHVDACQTVGKIPVDLAEIGCDCATIDAHKFHGPKGVGALWLRKGLRLESLMVGGPQERARRGGTENVAGIVGMGKAAELAKQHLDAGGHEKIRARRDAFERDLAGILGDLHVNGGQSPRLPNTSNLSFSRLAAEALVIALSEQGVCVSAGAACSSGSLEPSHVIKALNLPPKYETGAVRFSLSRYTMQSDLDAALAIVPGVVQRLAEVLPVSAA